MTYKNDNRARQPRRAQSQNNQRPQQSGGQNNWQRNFERYTALAAASNSDPVARENYWQHAEHFYRMMNSSAPAAE